MHHKLKGGMMQFRVEMTTNEFMGILESPRGSSHAIQFGRDISGAFNANKHAILVFDKEAEGFTNITSGARALYALVNDGNRSLRFVLTLSPKYGVNGIVTMKLVRIPKSRRK